MENMIEYGWLIVSTFLVVTILSFLTRKIITIIISNNSEKLFADPTNFLFLKNAIPFVLYSIGIFWVFQKIPYFNSLGNALFAGAGVIAAIIGFASQKAFSNIIGGLFILIFRPFRIGDIIEVDGRKGKVEQIKLIHTIIKDYQYQRVIVPNNHISDQMIINSTIIDAHIKRQIIFNLALNANIDDAIHIISTSISNHPLFIDERSPIEKENNIPPVTVKVVELSEHGIQLNAYVYVSSYEDAFNLKCDVLKSIKEQFDKVGIELYSANKLLPFTEE